MHLHSLWLFDIYPRASVLPQVGHPVRPRWHNSGLQRVYKVRHRCGGEGRQHQDPAQGQRDRWRRHRGVLSCSRCVWAVTDSQSLKRWWKALKYLVMMHIFVPGVLISAISKHSQNPPQRYSQSILKELFPPAVLFFSLIDDSTILSLTEFCAASHCQEPPAPGGHPGREAVGPVLCEDLPCRGTSQNEHQHHG